MKCHAKGNSYRLPTSSLAATISQSNITLGRLVGVSSRNDPHANLVQGGPSARRVLPGWQSGSATKGVRSDVYRTGTAERRGAVRIAHDKFETNGFYFSPLAATLVGNLIEHFSGVECAPPAMSDRLVLLVGHSAAYEVLRNEQRIREVLSGVHLCPPTS